MKLKAKYKGQRITIHSPKGDITFDSNINNESEYPWFNANGFSHLFTTPKAEVKTKVYKGIKNNNRKIN